MNYDTTQRLLDSLKPYCDLSQIEIQTESKDWRGRVYKSDLIWLVRENNVMLEVFDNEIQVSFFTDHRHFADYTTIPGDKEKYVEDAINFLIKLFTLPIRYVKVTKGTMLITESYFFADQDGKTEMIGSVINHLLIGNPFIKKTRTVFNWHYDKNTNMFKEYIPEINNQCTEKQSKKIIS